MAKNKYVKTDTERMMHEIGPDEFRETLAYYGIRPDSHGKFLCPFHNDRHIGNCGIMRVNPAKGRCYACGQTFDSVDLVKLNEGISEHWKAVQFVWTQILGRQLLTVTEENNNAPVLTKDEYRFLGLPGFTAGKFEPGPILDVRGETYRNSDLPEGMEFFEELADVESDMCPFGYRHKAPTADEMIRENPDFFFSMLENKANEKTVELLQLRGRAQGKDGPVPRLSILARICAGLLENTYPGITQQVMPMVRDIWEKKANDGIARVKKIAGTIRKMEKYHNFRHSPAPYHA